MVTALTLIILAVLIVFVVYKYLVNRRRNALLSEIPALPNFPIIGAMMNFLKPPEKIWKYLREIGLQYYPIYRFSVLNVDVVNILSPEDIEIILSSIKHTTKSMLYDMLHSWLGGGLLTSYGAKWHNRRKILTPTFHFHILEQFIDTFVEQSAKIVNKLEAECDKPWTNVVPLVSEYTLNSICETAMGTPMDEESSTCKRYVQKVHRIGEIYLHIITHPWCDFLLTFVFTPTFWELRRLVKELHAFSSSVIQKRKATFKRSDTKSETPSKRRQAMLDLLISAMNSGEPIDDQGIQEEVDTFIFEGHDTTSACISLTLLMLACHGDVQQKVVEEIQQVFGNSDRHPTHQDLSNLRYLEQVLKESLRMYPSVPLISRLTDEEVKMHSGYTIPAKSIVHIHIYDLHHNPTLYPDPYKFDPERFTVENSKNRHPFAYIPFSAGPRNCIGQRYAFLEIKIVIVEILKRFVLEAVDLPENITLLVNLVLRVKNGLRVKFKKR
uniref:Cytochrome P450 n=2 Tax=Photinus pyralis TaxID=7054 RepID=A0A1Y1NLM3_PHOPY